MSTKTMNVEARRMKGALASTALIVMCGVALSACGSESGEERKSTGEDRLVVDLEAGTYGGVGIGDTEADMKRAFGEREPASMSEPGSPRGADETRGPHSFDPAPEDARPRWFRYENVTFFFADNVITVIMVTDPDTSTADGLEMGSQLDAVRAMDPVDDLRCGVVNENTEYEPYPACSGSTASGHHVWFGGDPLANITVGTVPLEGV